MMKLLVTASLVAGTVVSGGSVAWADPPRSGWARLRDCESGGRYEAVTRGRFFGAYQFSLGTWRSVGGAGLPHQASAVEQDYRALYLYRMRGWQPWGGCVRRAGLREDGDARSRRVPTYVESAYMG
ncbi:transglycosylase family protein [Actinocrispum wychmicini]|uniref:Transglycosylase-like protein with SLT domain n=1 Tax=Actinocrispum wychmicini TaxID=1213861 RepID=A0A4R2JV30_9PSEU|nr:transglycosylase family protein [Actinocrispum wychmicini]TCO60899.1 transglycosylase-like protein with SLT domain [Actinocrispum wychmicini]